MNKKINELFEKDSVIRVISILIAILIWFLVLDQDNPFDERTLSVPLSSNVDVLGDNNLKIVGPQVPTTIDVKIKGRRNKIIGVTANDFRAFLDLSGVTESGTKRIYIDTPEYLGDQDLLISSINPTYVDLNFERIVGQQFPVDVELKGSLPEGYELLNLKVEPNSAILEEKESIISKVSKVIAQIDLDQIKDNKELVTKGIVRDSSGQELRQFESQVPIIATFDLARRVPIAAATRGTPAEDYYLKEIRFSMPQIRVIGTRSVLGKIAKINTEAIDISDKTENFEVSPVLIMPNGASPYKEDVDQLTAEVVIGKLSIRAVNMPVSSISIYGSDPSGKKTYRVSDENVTITIKGRPEVINSVKADDIKLSVQVAGLEEGEHEVPVIVDLPNNVSLVGEYSVNVMIETVPEQTTPGTTAQ